MIKKLNCVISLLFCAVIVFGQNQPSTDEYNKKEIFAGYSANNLTSGNPEGFVDPNSNSNPTYRGWNASAVYNFNRFVGVKADVAGFYKNTAINVPNTVPYQLKSSLYTYMGGIQIKDNKKTKRFSPFLQALIGVGSHTNKFVIPQFNLPFPKQTKNGLSMAFGGGLDLKVSKKVSIRLIQADYNPTFISGTTQKNVRLGFGIIFH